MERLSMTQKLMINQPKQHNGWRDLNLITLNQFSATGDAKWKTSMN